MKRITVLLILTVTALGMSGCNNTVLEKRDPALPVFEEQPVTITWKGDAKEGIQSYQARVESYAMNNRKDTVTTLRSTHRIAMKTIGDKVFSRIDFEADEFTSAESVISDGNETLFFNPITDEITLRYLSVSPESAFLRLFTQETGMSRINLSLIREEAQRLALDMAEEENGKKLVIDLPAGLFPQNKGETVTRRRVSFDTANDTLAEVELGMVLESGTSLSSTSTPIYEEKNGIPVKIGMVTVIDSKAAELIEGFDPETPIYNSIEDLPVLSKEDYDKLLEAGNVTDVPDMKFGDPADLSYTETYIEVYQDIEINNVSDQLFKLLLK